MTGTQVDRRLVLRRTESGVQADGRWAFRWTESGVQADRRWALRWTEFGVQTDGRWALRWTKKRGCCDCGSSPGGHADQAGDVLAHRQPQRAAQGGAQAHGQNAGKKGSHVCLMHVGRCAGMRAECRMQNAQAVRPQRGPSGGADGRGDGGKGKGGSGPAL